MGVNRGSQTGVEGRPLSAVRGVFISFPSRCHFDETLSVGIVMLAARSLPRRLARSDEPDDDDPELVEK